MTETVAEFMDRAIESMIPTVARLQFLGRILQSEKTEKNKNDQKKIDRIYWKGCRK